MAHSLSEMSSLPPLCQSGSFPTFKMCLPPPGNSPLQPHLAMPCGFQHAAGLLGVSALQSFHKLKHFSSRRFWSLAGRDHGSVFFVLTVPCAGLRTHECYTQKMLTDGLIQGTGPMPLFSLVVTAPGKHAVSAPAKQLGAAGGWLEGLPGLPMTCHNKRK